MNVKQVIEQLKAEPSTNGKIDLIKQFAETASNDFINTLKYTYDNLKVYGIKKYKLPEKYAASTKLDAVFVILDQLDQREYTGNKAIEIVENTLTKLSEEDAFAFDLILQRDLKCGVNKKLIKKALGDNMFFEIGYMGAVPYSAARINKLIKNEFIIFSQEKMDGEYSNLVIERDKDKKIVINFYSRQNKKQAIPSIVLKNIKTDIEKTNNTFFDKIILNGELTIDGLDRYTSNGLLTRIFKLQEYYDNNNIKKLKESITAIEQTSKMKLEEVFNKIRYNIWDYQDARLPYVERWKNLEHNIFNNVSSFFKPVETKIIYNREKLNNYIDSSNNVVGDFKFAETIEASDSNDVKSILLKHFQTIINRKGEGTIVKASSEVWKSGKPTFQIKYKFEFECEMKIVGFKQGNKGTKFENSLGAFKCKSEDGIVKADPSGISEDLRDEIWNNREDYLNKIITVKCNALSKSKDNEHYSLMHPRFIKFRDDKDQADTYEIVKEIQESIINTKKN